MLLLVLFYPLVVVSEYCYPQYCYNLDGTYIWCDQSEYMCTEGAWYWETASCDWVGSDGAEFWSSGVWCGDEETCQTDWDTGLPYCTWWGEPVEDNWDQITWPGEFSDAVEAGINMVTTIIICVVVGIVVLLVGCCVCCFYMGKGCFRSRERRAGENNVHPATTVNVQNTPQVAMPTGGQVAMPTGSGGRVHYTTEPAPQYPGNHPGNHPIPYQMAYNTTLPDPAKIRPV